MTVDIPALGKKVVILKSELAQIISALQTADYTIIGPKVAQQAIIYTEIERLDELPLGWHDEQGPGHYRLQPPAPVAGGANGRSPDNERYFDYVTGPHSAKKFLYPPRLTLFHTRRNDDGFSFAGEGEAPRYAFLGLRACDLTAIARQDRIFLGGSYQEPHYKARREQAFILAVNCIEPGQNCFCHSMAAGPRCTTGFDLALTELESGFLLEIGSEVGAEMLSGCAWRPAGAFELDQAGHLWRQAEDKMGRRLATNDLPRLLYDNLDHPRWDDVAERCLSCTNCTLVCPTCFCIDVQDISDLSGQETKRVRLWDSCFSPDFSYVHGGNLRPNTRSRYRQWLTHKLAAWVDQFGTLGCVGCGRCITWCPAGIDLTEEVAAIREGALS